MNSDPNIPDWDKTRRLLREHLDAPKMTNPDFVNSRVMEAIDRLDRKEIARPLFPLARFIWAGAFGLIVAAALSVTFLSGELQPRGQGDFLSQVIDARAEKSNLSISSFKSPDDRGVVLWIEGTDYIPPNEPVM